MAWRSPTAAAAKWGEVAQIGTGRPGGITAPERSTPTGWTLAGRLVGRAYGPTNAGSHNLTRVVGLRSVWYASLQGTCTTVPGTWCGGPPLPLFLSCPQRPVSMPVASLVQGALALRPVARWGWGAISGPLVW
jgi:hypothetical protein